MTITNYNTSPTKGTLNSRSSAFSGLCCDSTHIRPGYLIATLPVLGSLLLDLDTVTLRSPQTSSVYMKGTLDCDLADCNACCSSTHTTSPSRMNRRNHSLLVSMKLGSRSKRYNKVPHRPSNFLPGLVGYASPATQVQHTPLWCAADVTNPPKMLYRACLKRSRP